MSRTVLVIPCYDEARRLDVEAFAAFRLPGHDLQLLFVDDGSTDHTREVLARLCERDPERLRWTALDRNRGKGEAVRRGVLEALAGGAERVGYWDADLATPLEELPRFSRVLDEHERVDLVMGSRVQLLGRSIERKFYRHAYGRVFTTAVATLLDLPVYDTQCGAKLLRVSEDTAAAFAEPFVTRWIFDVEILARLMDRWECQGRDTAERVYELPLVHWRDVAGSKVTVADAVLAARDLGRIARVYRPAIVARRSRRRRG